MSKKILPILLVLSLLMAGLTGRADELKSNLSNIEEYAAQEQFTKALIALAWVRKELELKFNKSLARFFPAKLENYKVDTSGRPSQAQLVGTAAAQQRYSKSPESPLLHVGIFSSAAGRNTEIFSLCDYSLPGPKQKLEKTKVKGRQALLITTEASTVPQALAVCLEGGSVVFEGVSVGLLTLTKADLLKIGELFEYAELEKYLSVLR